MSSSPNHNPGLHRFALLVAVATFPLIFIGGLVTSHGAGMAVPDWPNSYGYNMFLFPPSRWVGNIWYEHVHRLYASFIGLLSIVLCAWAWFGDHRPRVRWLATAVLGMVIFQGVLGGLRVVLVKLNLAIVHGCVAQAFFCLAALVALVTSRWWEEAPDLSQSQDSSTGRRLTRIGVVAVAVVYCQLILGAVMRHEQAGLAIPDFPLTYGKVLPPTREAEIPQPYVIELGDTGGPDYAAPRSLYSRWMSRWPRQTFQPEVELNMLGKVWLAFAHRCGAVLVSLTLLVLVYKVLRRGWPGLNAPAIALVGLLLTQLTLGALTVLLRKPADVASAHVAVGALVLVTTFVLAARLVRLYRPRLEEVADFDRGFEVLRGNAPLGDPLRPARTVLGGGT